MIVDAETMDLVNAIEALLDDAPAGAIKPELMESVLEDSTDPCQNAIEAG
jgi:carboxylate-amine ligase